MTNPKELILHRERKGESEKTERLFKMFLNRGDREGEKEGKRWLRWMYTYLPLNERQLMNNCIKNSKEREGTKVPKEKIVRKKEELLESLEDFSKTQDIVSRKVYLEKTSLERKKILMENQSTIEIIENAFNEWKERKNKFKGATTQEWFKLWFEEMGPEEVNWWKNRMARLGEDIGIENIKQIKPFAEVLLKNENEDKEIGEKLWGNSKILGKEKAKEEEERVGEPVVFLGDIEARIKRQLKNWLYKGLSREEIEEEIEEVKAGAGYMERIIGELR